jgi:hypothetical protein
LGSWGEVPNAPSKSWLPSITKVQWIVTTNYPLLLSPANLAAVTTHWPTKARVWIGSHWFGIFFHWVSVPMVTIMVSIRDAVWCLILTLFLLSFCCFAFSPLWPRVPSNLSSCPYANKQPTTLKQMLTCSLIYLLYLPQRRSSSKMSYDPSSPLLYLPKTTCYGPST